MIGHSSSQDKVRKYTPEVAGSTPILLLEGILYVLSDPYVDVALVGVREPHFVELNNDISDDVGSRIDGHEACPSEAHLGGASRSVCALRRMFASPQHKSF